MFEHPFPFDPTYGHTQNDLLAIGLPEAPPDFDAFWQNTFAENAQVPLDLIHMREDTSYPNINIFDITYSTLDNLRIGGWIVAPKKQKPTCGFVVSHGYGGRQEPERNLLHPNAVAIFPCAPGFNKSAHETIPNKSTDHVIHGITDKNTYIIRHSVAALWSAASALLELYPDVSEKLYFIGGSFGGGLGALALPYDARIKKAHLRVPTFGHHPLRLQCPCNGSGESVRRYHAEHPEVSDVLQYFDAATAASCITTPTLGSPALFDPAVPPPGQFAVCNALSDMHILSAGHFDHPQLPGENVLLTQKLTQWFAE